MRAIRASAYWRLTTTIASIHYSLPHTQLPQPAAGSASRSSQESQAPSGSESAGAARVPLRAEDDFYVSGW